MADDTLRADSPGDQVFDSELFTARTCERCHKPHDGSVGSGRFCSMQCARTTVTKERPRKKTAAIVAASRTNQASTQTVLALSFARRVAEYALRQKLCMQCEQPLSYEKRLSQFCTHKCANTHLAGLRKISSNCVHCAAPLTNNRAKYCSIPCHVEYRFEAYVANWKAGRETGHGSAFGMSAFVRRYVLRKAKYRCEECGWAKVNVSTGRTPLNVDHRDGDHSNNCEENLRVLCPNCHSLTANYGSLNRGKGRHRRRVEYEKELFQLRAARDTPALVDTGARSLKKAIGS